MRGPSVDIVVESDRWSALPDAEAIVQRAARAALAGAGVAVRDEAEISVLLTDDAKLQELNRTWRQQDKPTNVLSFPAVDPDELADAPALGDVALAYETLAREAALDDKSLADHLTHLVVHGMLHLLGHDHQEDDEADAMEALETRILAGLGIADPYADLPLDGGRPDATMAPNP